MGDIAQVTALPARGGVLLDARGGDRSLRVSWHEDEGLVVLSLWRRDHCTATFRLPAGDVPALVHALEDGLELLDHQHRRHLGSEPRAAGA